jgi:signal transduction histidine kinase
MSQSATIESFFEKIEKLNQEAWQIRVIDSNKAQALSKEAVDLAKKINYTKGIAEGLRTLGFSYIRVANFDDATRCLKESLSLFESLNDVKGESTVYEYLGIIERSLGNFVGSLELLLKSLGLSQQTGFVEVEITSRYQIGVTCKQLGNYEKALDNLYKSLSLARSMRFTLMEAYDLNIIGSIYFETGDYKQALQYYQQGLSIRHASGDKWGEAGSLDNIGFTFLKLGDYQQAIEFCNKSLDICKTSGDKKGQSNALLHLAESCKLTNDVEQARKYCNESLQIRQDIGDRKGEAEIYLFLADLQKPEVKTLGIDQDSQGLFKALEIAEEIKAVDLLRLAHWALYENYKFNKNFAEALKHLEQHFEIEKELHKDSINQKILFLEISHKAEESKKEAEIFRLRNVDLANLYEASKRQKEEIEQQKAKADQTLEELKTTQAQLIQKEKMASLGELTAGVAHEIQNPLNFINNFSDVNIELIDDLELLLQADNKGEALTVAHNIKNNEQKINHHGKRADAIVKGMLQHSRASTGKKELTDINALADEYLRLSYHGLRAKDNNFNAHLRTIFDENIGKIEVAPQDIGRVLMNLYNNAFYAVNEKKKQLKGTFEPTVEVSTKKVDNKIEISVKDNGTGISQKILDKIYQPFFTTKPTGQGTGLGLSLSYDIIKVHDGELKVETKEGEGAKFIIQLPDYWTAC